MKEVNLTEPNEQGIRYYQINPKPLIPQAEAASGTAKNTDKNVPNHSTAENSGEAQNTANTPDYRETKSAGTSAVYRESSENTKGESAGYNGLGGGNGGNGGNGSNGGNGGNYTYGGGNGSGPKKSSTKKAVIIVGIVLLICVGFAACAKIVTDTVNEFTYGFVESFTDGITNREAQETILPSEPYIAELHVDGEISGSTTGEYGMDTAGYHHNWTLKQMDMLMSDDNCKGIIFYLNTPGGTVFEIDELYLKIKEYQEKTGNPVYSYMGKMAASGGYYISAPCDEIIANRNCWTGSIGVMVGTYFDFSQLLENYGVKATTITSGPNKAIGSMVEEMTPEQKAILQGLVDEAYEQFVDVVAEGRDMKKEDVIKIADGRVYTAKQALKLGLVDDIMTFDEAVEAMKKDNNLENCGLLDIKYSPVSVIDSLFAKIQGSGIAALTGGNEVSEIISLTKKANSQPVSYVCELLEN